MEEEKVQGLDLVTIPREEYEQLVKDSEWLSCLEDAGVDNWSGYDFALELKRDKEK
jgi:hypothetical protein